MALAERFNGTVGGRLERIRTEASEIRGDFAGISQDVRDLARLEVQLAVAEAKEQGALAGKAAGLGAVAAIVALLALVFLALALHLGLATFMPDWLAALVTAAILLVLAGAAAMVARGYLKQISPLPRRTIASVKEDIRWAKSQLSSSVR